MDLACLGVLYNRKNIVFHKHCFFFVSHNSLMLYTVLNLKTRVSVFYTLYEYEVKHLSDKTMQSTDDRWHMFL